jgi:hypothetical protein
VMLTPQRRALRRSGMASTALRCTMCSGRSGAMWARDKISSMAYVSKDGGREARKVLYDDSGPWGSRGGSDACTASPTESYWVDWSAGEGSEGESVRPTEIGGIISAWNIRTVGSSYLPCQIRMETHSDCDSPSVLPWLLQHPQS